MKKLILAILVFGAGLAHAQKVPVKADYLDFFKKNFSPECELFDTEKVFVLKKQKDCLIFQSVRSNFLELGPKCLETTFKTSVKEDYKKICDPRLADSKRGVAAVNSVEPTNPEIKDLFVDAAPGVTGTTGSNLPASNSQQSAAANSSGGSTTTVGPAGTTGSATTQNNGSSTTTPQNSSGSNSANNGTSRSTAGVSGNGIGGLPNSSPNPTGSVAQPNRNSGSSPQFVVGDCGADCNKPRVVTYDFCAVVNGIGLGGGKSCYFDHNNFEQPEEKCDRTTVGTMIRVQGRVLSCMPDNATQPELETQYAKAEQQKATPTAAVKDVVLTPTKKYMWYGYKELFAKDQTCVSTAIAKKCDGSNIGEELANECYLNKCVRLDENKNLNLMHWSNIKTFIAASNKAEEAAYQAKQDAALSQQRADLNRAPAATNGSSGP